MSLPINLEVKKELNDGMFYRYNVNNQARFWFTDCVDKNEKHYIRQIHADIIDKYLNGFGIYIETDDENFCYKRVRFVAPNFVGNIEKAQEFHKKIEIMINICKAIDEFYK